MQKIRTRLVNFRVTDEEFEKLKTACDRQGARCLSDFARTLMLGNSSTHPDAQTDHLLALERRVEGLEASMSRLVSAFAGSKVDLAVSER